MTYELICGDALTVLRTLPSNSVQCCVTSPPYYGLRSYVADGHPDKPLEIGLEETPEAYVAKLVEVFREVRRVLHPSGTLWLNIGDSYNGDKRGNTEIYKNPKVAESSQHHKKLWRDAKPKDLLGIPWMVAFALRADGWWLRQEIIWHKLAPMPESVTDRCTKAHEQVFLLAKSERYYFDHIAIREGETVYTRKGTPGGHKLTEQNGYKGIAGGTLKRDPDEPYGFARDITTVGRNKRSVWTLGPESYSGAHFAVMPTKLVEPCVLAGTSAKGCCAKCGAPWERVVEREKPPEIARSADAKRIGMIGRNDNNRRMGAQLQAFYDAHPPQTTGWQPTCQCSAPVIPCTVLDPFNGAATTGIVSIKHGRNYIGIDLNEQYLALSRRRLEQVQPMLLEAL